MKQFILTIFIILTLNVSSRAGWFSNDQPYQQQIQDLQTQLAQQTHTNNQMIVVIIILATGVIIALITGAAIGSKARKAAKEVKN